MSTNTLPKLTSRAAAVQIVQSPGGVVAWLVEDYAVPLVAIDMAFHGGGAQDPADKAGTAAMMAALLDEGAGDYDSDTFHRLLDDKAIEISFNADRDLVAGRAKTLAKHVDAAAELLRLAVCVPRFDEQAVDRVRAQMSAALRREAKDPDSLASRAWREAAFPNHPYGQPTRGTLESLAGITRDDLVATHQATVCRGNLKIAVVGAIDAQRLGALLDQVFGALPAAAKLKPVADVVVPQEERRTVVDLDVPQATIRFGTNGIARRDPDHMAAVVLNHILGGGVFSARLFREVREKRGLAYSVHTQLATFDHAALFSGGTSTKNERAGESLSVIEAEIAKIAAEGPTADELAKAKKYLTGSYALRFDSSVKIASQLVHLQTEGFGVEYLDERNALIEAVTLEDTRRVAKRLFEGKGLLVTVVGRPEGIA